MFAAIGEWSFDHRWIVLAGSLLLLIGALFAAFLAVSQLMINSNPWGLWIVGPLIALAAALFIASQVGQRFARAQMHELRNLINTELAPSHPAQARGDVESAR